MSNASGPKPEAGAAPANWQGKSLGVPWGHRLFIFLLRNIGLHAAYALLWPVAFWYLLFAKGPREAVRKYRHQLHPIKRKPWRLAAYRQFLVFGKVILDKVAVRSGLSEKYTYDRTGGEHIQAMVDGGKGGVLISAHLGNWELAGHLLKRYKGKVSVVMLDAERQAVKDVHRKAVEEASYEVIPADGGVGTAMLINAALAKGRLICLHGDRRMPNARARRVSFLGKPALFPLGPFAMASATRAPVSFCFVVRTDGPGYRFTATPSMVGHSPNELMDAFVAALEVEIHQSPDQWFNFFDFWADADDPTAGARRRTTLPATAPTDGDGA
ncbi:MAG: hypothetical protein WAU70_12905 [Flavobacteriales bacterium]